MFLQNFDFISPSITLFYHNKTQHSSISSGIFSIIILIIIFSLIFYLSLDFLFLKNPSSMYYKTYIDDVDIYYFNSSSLFHYVFINQNDLFNITIDEKYFSIIGVPEHDGNYLLNTNMSFHDHYIYGPCDFSDVGDKKNILTGDYLKYYKYSFCIKKFYNSSSNEIIFKDDTRFVYPFLQHGASKINNRHYNIYFQRYQNHTVINNNSCYEKNVFFNTSGYLYNIIFITQNIKVKDYKDSIKFNFQRVSNFFNSESYTSNHLNFSPMKLITHTGKFLDQTSEQFSYNYDFNEKLINFEHLEIFGAFHFWMQNTLVIYERTYQKIQDISGNIDGIIEIITLVVKFLNMLFFSDYQILYDFNKEIEQLIDCNLGKKNNLKFKKNFTEIKTSKINNNINLYNKINNNNFINNINETSNNSHNILRDNYLFKSETPKILDIFKTKIEIKYKKITWLDALCGFKFNFKKNYLNFITNERMKIISEENLIRNHLGITKLKKFVSFKEDSNMKHCGHSPLINLKDIY